MSHHEEQEEVTYVYKLNELFSIIPDYEGDQILLNTFLNSCNSALQLAEEYQIPLIVLHIKNKLKGRASQLINSRNLNTWHEIRDLLLIHFGDSRDLTSLIHDLQKLKQLPNESPLTFAHKVESHNAKLHAAINSQNLTTEQKLAQEDLIEQMCLDTLLTGLEPKLCPIIRASNPTTRGEAIYRIKRELQLSYLETQRSSRYQNQNQNFNHQKRPPQSNKPTCSYCKKIGHTIDVCYKKQNQNLGPLNTNSLNYNNTHRSSQPNNFRNSNNYQRPSVIQSNPNFQRNTNFNQNNHNIGNSQNTVPRNHHLNSFESQDIQTGTLTQASQPSHSQNIDTITTQLQNLNTTDNYQVFLN